MKSTFFFIILSLSVSFLSKGQGFFNYSFTLSLQTPPDKFMYEGDNGITSLPDSTECELKFFNPNKNEPAEIIIKGIYKKKVGSSFLFSSKSKLSFLVNQSLSNARPILPKTFIPIDTTKLNKIASEKAMYEIWRTNINILNKDLSKRLLALSDQDKINAFENIKNWPYSVVESLLIKQTTDKNPDVAKSAQAALIHWRKTILPILL